MSEFDVFFDEYEVKHNCSPEKRECFEAGQQSKQAEVDELKKRIDEALEAFDDGSFNYCRKILKGNTNDH